MGEGLVNLAALGVVIGLTAIASGRPPLGWWNAVMGK
jgi:hypothetical protein